ncbi:transcription factor Vhr1-domain-containing protein [Scheffersomyces xylosifermentans]|uniref:transcription factor Vhr1-domain-containing protein n=1 Tax=Scheffersomyces xylosifermentans TaxID=1304137 RepID=UPI00315C6E5D
MVEQTVADIAEQEHQKRLGVTHAIRVKLNFLDERLWKRFSARRLELIDTLDLSSRKASEQDAEIKKVAEALRIEFNYTTDYEQDFDKLVRAAVQSVRRNRKRSSKSKRHNNEDNKRSKSHHDHSELATTISPADMTNGFSTIHSSNPPDIHKAYQDEENDLSDNGPQRSKFLSEIARLNSDSNDDIYDLNYPRTKTFSSNDKAKVAIDSMITPRIGSSSPAHIPNPSLGMTANHTSSASTHTTKLPPIMNLNIESHRPPVDASSSKGIIINHIERSKSCSESVSKKSENLQVLGKSIIAASIAYVFEKSFENVNDTSVEYLRNKLNTESYLSRFFRDLDPNVTNSISDEIAVISLYTLLGGCVKDFGFDAIVMPLCEIIYVSILQDYPLIAKNSNPFRSTDYLKPTEYSNSLNSLAAVASDISMQERGENMKKSDQVQYRKQVFLRFLSKVLEFSYLTKNLAPPRFIELIENARVAFKLNNPQDNIIGLRDIKNGNIIQTDFDLERIFRTQEKIELEIFTQRSTAIPIYEITSTVIPSRYGNTESPKIILPPPFANRPQLSHSRSLTAEQLGEPNKPVFNFLSNSDDLTPPPPLLPKFQPLL